MLIKKKKLNTECAFSSKVRESKNRKVRSVVQPSNFFPHLYINLL